MEYDILVWYALCAFFLSSMCFLMHGFVSRNLVHRKHRARGEQLLHTLEVGQYVLCWYGISVCFTLLNKWLVHEWHGTGFAFPVTVTAVHMTLKLIVTRIWACKCRAEMPEELPKQTQYRITLPIGSATALDVALSNLSFLFISVSFYTIIKSTSILWILLWALVLRIEKPSARVFAVIFAISVGLALASYGEVEFNLLGFLMVMGAAAVGGLRWSLTQFLTQEAHECDNPLVVMYHIAPWSTATIVPAALVMDWIPALFWPSETSIMSSPFLASPGLFAQLLLVVMCGGVVSFFLVLTEVKLLQLTSSLTMGVFGNLKEIVQIGLSMLIFHDKVTVLNVTGLVVTLAATHAFRVVRKHDASDHLVEYDRVAQADMELAVMDLANLRSSSPI